MWSRLHGGGHREAAGGVPETGSDGQVTGKTPSAPSPRGKIRRRRRKGGVGVRGGIPDAGGGVTAATSPPPVYPLLRGWMEDVPEVPGEVQACVFGLTVRSTEHEDLPKIAKGLGFERLALETDAPYLPPPGHNPNHPWLIHHQASLVAQHRNLPVSAVLEGATANVRRFFRI